MSQKPCCLHASCGRYAIHGHKCSGKDVAIASGMGWQAVSHTKRQIFKQFVCTRCHTLRCIVPSGIEWAFAFRFAGPCKVAIANGVNGTICWAVRVLFVFYVHAYTDICRGRCYFGSSAVAQGVCLHSGVLAGTNPSYLVQGHGIS